MSPNYEQVLKANADFSTNLYKVFSKDAGNVVYSPLSAHAILSLATQGAAGKTEKCLAKALNLPDPQQTSEGYKTVMETLNNMKSATVHFANKVYVKDQIKEEFQSVAENYFCSEIQQVDFKDNVNTAHAMNSWVEEKTEGNIKDLITPESLDEETAMVLLNALYFKGLWNRRFNESWTRKERFYPNENETVEVDVMYLSDYIYYKYDPKLEAEILELPYVGREASFIVILPNSRNGIAKLEKKLAQTNLTLITQGTSFTEIELSLPKFKIENRIELGDALKKLGLRTIFEPGANFSGLLTTSKPLRVSEVVQKVFIEVDESGTEAGAATYMGYVECCSPPQCRVNHPFVFLLVSRCNDSLNILLQGRVVLPKY